MDTRRKRGDTLGDRFGRVRCRLSYCRLVRVTCFAVDILRGGMKSGSLELPTHPPISCQHSTQHIAFIHLQLKHNYSNMSGIKGIGGAKSYDGMCHV